MKKLAVVLLVSFGAMSASAANWVAAAEDSKDGIYTYVDTESISTQGKYKQAFVKMLSIPEGFFIISLISYDCRSNPRRSKPTYAAQYDLEGNVTRSGLITNNDFLPVIPGTLGETQANMICNL
ncbi:hypothetical protein ACT3TH_01220 [Psychrobacter sp. AOP22-C1-C5]|uniref:hypothetical protein n=1 Tax=Psychrobacter sp. AOP22-C1-C5 TaxID=3457716 RepID=UPI0040355EDE